MQRILYSIYIIYIVNICSWHYANIYYYENGFRTTTCTICCSRASIRAPRALIQKLLSQQILQVVRLCRMFSLVIYICIFKKIIKDQVSYTWSFKSLRVFQVVFCLCHHKFDSVKLVCL